MGNIIKSIESEVSKLLEESEKNSNMAAAGYDEGWYVGEMNAYEKVFNLIEKLKEKDIKASKRVIGYDDFGKPLHEGDFCTFDVNAADWRFKPDNIRKSGLATLEGQVTYDEQDKCFELSIDNDYCPALYFHAIEPGSLRLDMPRDIVITPDAIVFKDIESYNNEIVTAYLEETDELDRIMGIYTKDTHIDAFVVNYYGKENLNTDNFEVIACVTVYDRNLLKKSFPDIADKVIKMSNTYEDIEPVIIPLDKQNLDVIKDKFDDFYEEYCRTNDIER